MGGEIGEGLGGDVVDSVALGEPLGAVVEGGDRDVAGDVIEGEEEMEIGILGNFGLEGGGNEPVVELLAGGF